MDSVDNDKSVVILDTTTDNLSISEIDTTVQEEEAKSTVISEADSTQNGKVNKDVKEDAEVEKSVDKAEAEKADTPVAEESTGTYIYTYIRLYTIYT